jgi:glycerol-3-phosphate dehydrogenase
MHRNLAQLAGQEYDVLVIGGGIYGVCVAWDAILRGLSVALVEKGDFGHATSSNSLRVIHGGLRYLQHGDIRRMRQSMHERTVFMRIAPHLVHPLPILIPTYGHGKRGKAMFSLALVANHLIGLGLDRLEDPQKHLPQGRVISREECLRLVPHIERRDLTGGVIVHDCQMRSSERLVLAFARSASKAGAELANYVEVTGFLAQRDRVIGVTARDVLTGDELDIRGRVVVNASGPWVESVLNYLHGDRPQRRIPLSKAFNLLLNHQLIAEYAVGVYGQSHFNDRDAILRKGSRLFFISPWHHRSLIGTAHLPYADDAEDFQVTAEEVQSFVDAINQAYPAANLKLDDVCHVYGGLLPANGNGSGDVQLTKRHRLYDHRQEDGFDGLISVVGVKFTEARYVASKAVELVFSKLGKRPRQSPTATTHLDGGQIERLEAFLAQESQRRAPELGAEVVRGLICQYGSAYSEVLKYVADEAPVARPLIDLSSIVKAQVLHAVREEMAQKLADVLFRRTTLGVSGELEGACLRACAAIMATELGWDETTLSKEVEEVQAATCW